MTNLCMWASLCLETQTSFNLQSGSHYADVSTQASFKLERTTKPLHIREQTTLGQSQQILKSNAYI